MKHTYFPPQTHSNTLRWIYWQVQGKGKYKRGGSNRGGQQQGGATQLTHFPLTSVNAWGACLKWELWCPPHPASHPSAFKVEQVCESAIEITWRMWKRWEKWGIPLLPWGRRWGVYLEFINRLKTFDCWVTTIAELNTLLTYCQIFDLKAFWAALTNLLGDWTRFRRLCPRFEIWSWGDGDLYLGERLPWKRAQILIEQGAFVFWGYLG